MRSSRHWTGMFAGAVFFFGALLVTDINTPEFGSALLRGAGDFPPDRFPRARTKYVGACRCGLAKEAMLPYLLQCLAGLKQE